MQLVLFRHGETQWNLEGRKQGFGDSPLTEAGRDRARLLSQHLVDSGLCDPSWTLVCSPLGRAVTTATLIGEQLGISADKLVHESSLKEADHGDWEGLTNQQIDTQFPGQRKARLRDHWWYRTPNGESYADVHRRVGDWMKRVPDHARLIVVTHAMTSRCVRGNYLGLEPDACLASSHHDHDRYFVLDSGQIEVCCVEC